MSVFTEANRKAFNTMSEHYDSKPWQQALSQQVGRALRSHDQWLGIAFDLADKQGQSPLHHEFRLLDYACGTGSVTQALAEHATFVRGIDISENMVSRYNAAARAAGWSEDDARAVVGNICLDADPVENSEELSSAEFQDFNLAVVALGFHHFEDPKTSIRKLSRRVRSGTGIVCIVDFLPKWQEELLKNAVHGVEMKKILDQSTHHQERHDRGHDHGQESDTHSHGMTHTIKHDGFTESEMANLFKDAGLVDIRFDVLEEPTLMEFHDGSRERRIFLACARRP